MVSKSLNISTARVAVLIRKMVDKGLITRETGANDARVVELKLTEHGREVVESLQRQRDEQMGRIIDKVGIERILEYIEISQEMQSVMMPFSMEL